MIPCERGEKLNTEEFERQIESISTALKDYLFQKTEQNWHVSATVVLNKAQFYCSLGHWSFSTTYFSNSDISDDYVREQGKKVVNTWQSDVVRRNALWENIGRLAAKKVEYARQCREFERVLGLSSKDPAYPQFKRDSFIPNIDLLIIIADLADLAQIPSYDEFPACHKCHFWTPQDRFEMSGECRVGEMWVMDKETGMKLKPSTNSNFFCANFIAKRKKIEVPNMQETNE